MNVMLPTGSAEFQHFILRFNKTGEILSCPRIVLNNKGKSRSTGMGTGHCAQEGAERNLGKPKFPNRQQNRHNSLYL
jgi:hypothetical protein